MIEAQPIVWVHTDKADTMPSMEISSSDELHSVALWWVGRHGPDTPESARFIDQD
jgi:hypothetical protein